MPAPRLALLATTAVVAFTVPSADAAPCRPLLTDPRGDSSYADTGDALRSVEDGRLTDLLSVDLGSDRKELTARIQTVGRDPEGGTSTLDHLWHVDFSTATERFSLSAQSNRLTEQRFTLYRIVAGDDVPEDEERPSASAGVGVDTVVSGTIDEVAGRIVMRVPVSAFTEFGGLGRQLTTLRAGAYSGLSANVVGEYTSTDFGSTRSRFRVGTRGCP